MQINILLIDTCNINVVQTKLLLIDTCNVGVGQAKFVLIVIEHLEDQQEQPTVLEYAQPVLEEKDSKKTCVHWK